MPYGEAEKDKKILRMLRQAIQDEKEDAVYYDSLMRIVKDQSDKEVIRQIKMDTEKHDKLLNRIYQSISGEDKTEIALERREISGNIIKEYEKCIFSRLDAVDFYRKIYYIFMNPEGRDIIFEIITDKQAHAVKFNYLYAKYR